MDIPILVQRQDSSWVDYNEIKEVKNTDDKRSSRSSSGNITKIISDNKIIRMKGIGPDGWENAIQKIILELD